MLRSESEHYRSQQQLNALALRAVRRASTVSAAALAVGRFQAESIMLTLASVPGVLAEQRIQAPPVGEITPARMITDPAAVRQLLTKAATADAADRLALALVGDAGRTAAAVDIARRPGVTSHVRSLNLPSCGRCAVLAGRVYRWSAGFMRHPRCDCLMTPTTVAVAPSLTLDGESAAIAGQIRGLSKADVEAVANGASLSQVVNVRRDAAGLTVSNSVWSRAGRPTPAAIIATSDGDRDRVLELLGRHGYLT